MSSAGVDARLRGIETKLVNIEKKSSFICSYLSALSMKDIERHLASKKRVEV